jgi:hypothetical protein
MGVILGVWVVFGILAIAVGSGKKMGTGLAFVLGLVLGPIGLIIVAVSPDKPMLEQIDERPEAAGWYRDPTERFAQRYFDGDRWTKHVTSYANGERAEDTL